MSTDTRPALESVSVPEDWVGEMRYVARQPILNLRGQVHGYELLFRGAPEAVFSAGADMAARTMLDNAVIFGLDWITNGLPAFVSCTAESLTEDLVLVLSPEKTVLVLPAELELTPRLLESCSRLKARGYRLALDDLDGTRTCGRLPPLADYLRVEGARIWGGGASVLAGAWLCSTGIGGEEGRDAGGLQARLG